MVTADKRITFLQELATAIVKEKSRDSLEQIVWDKVFDELMGIGWSDVLLYAEDYGLNVPEP